MTSRATPDASNIHAPLVKNILRVVLFVLLAGACLFTSTNFTPFVPLILTAGLFLALLLSRSPKLALVLWLFSVAFVPFWVGVDVGAYISPAAAIALIILLVIGKYPRLHLNTIDVVSLVLLLVCIFSGVLGLSRVGDVSTVVTQWGLGYVMGRVLAAKAGYKFALYAVLGVFTTVAVMAIVEFLSGWNPYMALVVNNEYFRAFGRLQMRGDIVRAEWAFGHSIALGHALVLAIPLAIGLRYPRKWKVIAISILLFGVFVSFSRGAQVSAVLAVVLSVVFVRGVPVMQRFLISAGVLVAAVLALPQIESVLANAGPEAEHSVDYRKDLLALIPSMRPLGLAEGANEATANVVSFGDFGSIDSTFLFIGLRFGALPAIFAVVACLLAVIAVVRLRAPLPLVAIVAILPGVLTASLITQYGMLVWFYVGLASTALAVQSAAQCVPADQGSKTIDSLDPVVARGSSLRGRKSD